MLHPTNRRKLHCPSLLSSSRILPLLLIAALLLLTAVPALASAASFQFSVTLKTAYDKMVAAADKTLGAKLTAQYNELQRAQKLTIEWEAKSDQLHYRNEAAELAAKERIKQVDSAKLVKLQAEAERTKQKYEPLFALYDSLKQQHGLAKATKNKLLTSAFAAQVETTKAAVQLAKLDIRRKEDALRIAKADTAKTVKTLKELLGTASPVKIKIKAAKSAISSLNKQFTTEASSLNQAVRKGDATGALGSMTRMNGYVKQINDQRAAIYSFEQQISAIIARVNAQPAMK